MPDHLAAEQTLRSTSPGTPPADLAPILALCPDALIVFDRDFRILYANPRAIRVSHLELDGSVGKLYWDLRPDARNTLLEENFRGAMDDRRPRRFEYFYDRFDLWVDVQVFPHADGLAAFYKDITAERHAQNSRNASMQHIEEVFASTPDAIIILDRNWTCTFANQHAIDLCAPVDLLGHVLWEVLPGNLDEPFFSTYQRTMEERVPGDLEAYYAQPLNRWYSAHARPLGEDSIIIFFSDITSRKAAEERRDDLTRRLDQVLTATSDAVVILNRDYNFTFINRKAGELMTPAGDPLGQNLWEMFPGTVYENSPYVEHYRRAMDDGKPGGFEAFYPAPLDLWLRIEARPFPDGIILFFRDITADRLATDALRLSENRYRALTELNPQLIFTCDPHGTITFANQSLLDFLGMPKPDPRQQGSWLAAIHPEDRDVVVEHWTASLRSGNKYTGIARVHRSSDNQFRWLDMTALPVRDAQGTIQSWLGVASDIHDQKSAAEALATSEERYRILTDLNPQFIWLGAADGRITYANQRFLEYIGPQHTPDQTGKWIEAFDPDDRDRVLAAWSACVASGADYDIEARLIRDADGHSRWFRLRASPVREESGSVLHWLGVAIDIHESRTFAETLHQKQLETERQRSELESIYENTPVGLALFDPVTFRYLRINDELAKMIDLPKDKIIGRSVLEIASGVASIGELFRQVSTGKPVRDYIIEGELSSSPGIQRTWNVNYFPVYDGDGKITGITTASLEVTQQKKTEAALVQSEKLAAVGRLASSISHEINNPLEAITNLLYLLALSPGLPDDLKVYVNLAQSELARVSQIATQTLRFHRQAVRPTSVTAAQLVDAVLNLYQGRLANSGIRVEAEYAVSTEILCFENDIRQVLNNLIANAIDAMRGGGRILVRAHDTTDRLTDRRGVRITIADTGHGMSPKTLARLYEPFYTTKDLNGTGLGLWISHGIVTRHKGRLHVRSTQHPTHHGTIFSLFLPCIPD